MAVSSHFGFTNVTPASKTLTPTSLGITNYSLLVDEPNEVKESNPTAPIDQPEYVSFKCQDVNKVSTSFKNLYPEKVQSGVQYVVKVEELLSTTSTTDESFRVDTPIVAYLTIRHSKNAVVTSDVVDTVFKRLLGAVVKEDGTTRFKDLMRQALKPTTN